MKDQVKTPIIVVAAVAIVALLVVFGMKAFNSGNLDNGQVQYTPGKPPWLETDPAKKGPGGPPGGGGFGAPSAAASAPASADSMAAGHAPPGMTAPVLGGSGK